MRKSFICLLIILMPNITFSQIENPPLYLDFENFPDLEVATVVPDSELNPYILYTVRDLRQFMTGVPQYSTGMIVTDINQPKYPLLYIHLKNVEGCGGTCAQLNDARVYQTPSGPQLMVYKEIGHLSETADPILDFHGFILYNENLEPIDTLTSPNLDFHDFMIHPISGNKLYADYYPDSLLFPASLTGFPNDSLLAVDATRIVELDPNDNIVFEWISSEHLTAEDMYWDMFNPTGDVIDWDHWNSVTYDADDNLLVSFRHIGLVKVFRPDVEYPNGRTMIFSGKNSSFNLPPEHTTLLQHNFYYRPDDGYYYCYSNGNNQFPEAELQSSAYGFIYDINWQDTTYNLIQKFSPSEEPLVSMGGGNWHKNTDDSHIFNLAGFINIPAGNPLEFQPAAFYSNADDEVHYEFSFEEGGIFSYQFHSFDITDFNIERPEIICEETTDGLLLSTSKSYGDYLWSTGETSATILIQNPDTISISVALNDYFASSSLPQYFSSISTCSTVNTEDIPSYSLVDIYPNPSDDFFFLTSEREQKCNISIYNNLGIKMFEDRNVKLNAAEYKIPFQGNSIGIYHILIQNYETGINQYEKIFFVKP